MKRIFIKLVAFIIAKFYLRKSDLQGLIGIKFENFSTLFKTVTNELCYIFKLPVSYKLISANIELTNECNLHCMMCPVGNNSMKRKKTYMPPELFKKIIDENPQLDFILIFQWGESLLHKELVNLIRYAAQRGIRVFLTTNGTLLNRELGRKIIESGLERLTFSIDGIGNKHEEIREFSYEKLKYNIIEFKKTRDEMKSRLKIDISMVVFERTIGEIDAYRKEWEGIADRVQFIPKFIMSKRKIRCRELWRGTFTILADGKVVPCCADFEGENVVGDIRKSRLSEIWNNKIMRRLRKAHIKKRFYGICTNCEEYESPLVSKRFN